MIEALTTIKKNLKSAKFTYIILIYSTCVYLSIMLTEKSKYVTDVTLSKFGAPTAIEIFAGQYWGIITNSFVHFQLGHLVLNIFATLFIASYVERRIGFFKLFIF